MQIPVRIVLVETSHPGNIGASARAMKTMGLADLALVRPRAFPDAEATARASGADDILANAGVFASLEAAVADCGFVVGASARLRSVAWPLAEPRRAAALILARAETNRTALVFGPEQSGLTNEHLALCQRLVRIPTQPEFGSLNLAMAVQVLCYELRMAWLAASPEPPAEKELPAGSAGTQRPAGSAAIEQPASSAGTQRPAGSAETERPAGSAEPKPLASSAELEGLFTHLESVLTASGFLRTDHPQQLKLKLRRLFQRAELDRNDVNILRGVLTSLDPSKRRAERD